MQVCRYTVYMVIGVRSCASSSVRPSECYLQRHRDFREVELNGVAEDRHALQLDLEEG